MAVGCAPRGRREGWERRVGGVVVVGGGVEKRKKKKREVEGGGDQSDRGTVNGNE